MFAYIAHMDEKVFSLEDAVEQLRRRQGKKTLREFSDESGIDFTTLSAIYNGRRDLSPKALEYLGLEKVMRPSYRKAQVTKPAKATIRK